MKDLEQARLLRESSSKTVLFLWRREVTQLDESMNLHALWYGIGQLSPQCFMRSMEIAARELARNGAQMSVAFYRQRAFHRRWLPFQTSTCTKSRALPIRFFGAGKSFLIAFYRKCHWFRLDKIGRMFYNKEAN